LWSNGCRGFPLERGYPRIIAAIIEAHRRGVLVTVILDKISPSQKGEGADPVHDAGIPTFIDRKPKIAHNKVVVKTEGAPYAPFSAKSRPAGGQRRVCERSHSSAAKHRSVQPRMCEPGAKLKPGA
jgi:hypothetical protein